MEKKLRLTAKELEAKQKKLKEELAKKRQQKIDNVAVKKPEFDEDLIYHDPDYYDEEFTKLQKMFGITDKDLIKIQEKLQKEVAIKRDNIGKINTKPVKNN